MEFYFSKFSVIAWIVIMFLMEILSFVLLKMRLSFGEKKKKSLFDSRNIDFKTKALALLWNFTSKRHCQVFAA